MKIVKQNLEQIIGSLSPLDVNWMDDTAVAIMARLKAVPKKSVFDRSDIAALIEADDREGFTVSQFCVGSFLGYSKDKLEMELKARLSPGGFGIKRFKSDREIYLDALVDMGLIDAMTLTVNANPVWSDLLKERIRFGRGSAIQGQKRGRELEDFVEVVIREVFGDAYEARCTFQGVNGLAKCDFAIPNKATPLILIEVKGYGATGSKMSDIIGDVDAIIGAKRHDASLLLFTDGLTWKERANDMRKLIQRQNDGRIARVYTKQMRQTFKKELEVMKADYQL